MYTYMYVLSSRELGFLYIVDAPSWASMRFTRDTVICLVASFSFVDPFRVINQNTIVYLYICTPMYMYICKHVHAKYP